MNSVGLLFQQKDLRMSVSTNRVGDFGL